MKMKIALLRGTRVKFDGTPEEYCRLDAITKCGDCGKKPTKEGHDGCLGLLPGVAFACCGHGDPERSYIAFTNGVVVRGFEVDTASEPSAALQRPKE